MSFATLSARTYCCSEFKYAVRSITYFLEPQNFLGELSSDGSIDKRNYVGNSYTFTQHFLWLRIQVRNKLDTYLRVIILLGRGIHLREGCVVN